MLKNIKIKGIIVLLFTILTITISSKFTFSEEPEECEFPAHTEYDPLHGIFVSFCPAQYVWAQKCYLPCDYVQD